MTEDNGHRKLQPTFTDGSGRQWDLTLDAVLIQRVRDEEQIDLASLTDEGIWQKLDQDVVLFVNVLHALVREQCEPYQLDATGFAKSLGGDGDVLEAAYHALLDAVELFTPPRRRSLWRTLVQQQTQILSRGVQVAVKKLEDPKLQEKLLETMAGQMDSAVEGELIRLRSAGPTPRPAD